MQTGLDLILKAKLTTAKVKKAQLESQRLKADGITVDRQKTIMIEEAKLEGYINALIETLRELTPTQNPTDDSLN